MKTLVLLGDGMGDFPVAELGDRTLAGSAGSDDAQNSGTWRLAHGQYCSWGSSGSDVANMAILGYDAALNYTGRAPIEAAGADIPMAADEVAFR